MAPPLGELDAKRPERARMVRKKGYFMELVLYKGRPADCTGRLEKEIRTYDLLDALGLEYWRTDHAFMKADTMEDCKVIDDCLGATVCKNLFLCNRQKTNFYLLCMPPHKAFHTKDLSHQIGSARLSFAPEEQLWELLHCTPGSATILGLMNDDENRVQLLIDKETYEAEYFSCHPCLCTSTIKLKTSDVKNMLLPKVHHEPIVVEL